jgi:hypothetical protein
MRNNILKEDLAMKNFLYFMVGLVWIPMDWMRDAVYYVRDYGRDSIEGMRMKKNIRNLSKTKKIES